MWTNHQTSQEHTNIMVASFATSSIHIFLCLVGPSFWKLYFLSISFVSNVSLRLFLFHRSLFVSLCESDPGWEVFRMSSRLSLLPLSLFLSLSLSLSAEHKATGIMGIIEHGPLSAGPHCLWEGHCCGQNIHTLTPQLCYTHISKQPHTKHTNTIISKITYTIIIDSKIY